MIDQADFGVGTYLHPRVALALAVPRRQTASEWAAENRVLGPKETSEPGKWSNRRAPYLVGIMDALCDPDVAEVFVMKAAQTGVSEAMRNVLGYWIAVDPGPVLWVMPNQDSAEEAMAERIVPMIRETPALAAHLSTRKHDVSKQRVLLDHMDVHCGHATSPQSLASRPCRYAVLDELGKYPPFSGREADPQSLAKKRLTTYGHRAKLAALSTPTIRDHDIHAEWEACPLQLHYHVPCPHCGEHQVLAWPNVRWPADLPGTRAEQGAAVHERSLAWYHCGQCATRIDERQREAMVALGVWADPRRHRVSKSGAISGPDLGSRRVGFHVPAMISPWVTWSQMAGEYVAAVGDEGRMMDWRNSRLGEPFEIRAASVRSDLFDQKARAGHKPGSVPAWATVLLATADTQKDHFWYVIRAWGPGFRSRLIDYGRIESFDKLRARCLETRFPHEDRQVVSMAPTMLAIDSGGGTADESSDQNRTHQVYQFALSDPARIYAVKGWGGARALEAPMRQVYLAYDPPGGKARARLALYHLNVGYFKDILAERMANDPKAEDSWEIHNAIDAAYKRQMTSEHKVLMRRGRTQIARWVPVSSGAPNHLWDCEMMQVAASHIAHVEQPAPKVVSTNDWFTKGRQP